MIELRYNFLHWFKRPHFLYIFGFLAFFKPINPFFYDSLISSKNITEEQYAQDIYPVSAYTALFAAYIIFLLVFFDFSNLVFGITCIGGIIISVFVWQSGVRNGILDMVFQLQVVEAFSGSVAATEIVYFASIYVCQDGKRNFAQLTSYIRAMPLFAKMVSGILAQVVITKGWLDYDMLAFLSLPACVHATVLLMHMPSLSETEDGPDTFFEKVSWLKIKFKETLLGPHVVKWSLWSAFTICGYTRFSALMPRLWREGQKESGDIPNNGAVEGISAFLSVLGVLLSGTLSTKWKRENSFFCIVSLLQSALLMGIAHIEHVWDSTIVYLIQEIAYHFSMSVISAMIANTVHGKGFIGFVFVFVGLVSAGVNALFVGVINNAIGTLTFREEFIVYGVYHLIIAVLMILCYVLKL